MAINQSHPYTKESEQEILKKSRDDKYNVLAFLPLVENGNNIYRLKGNADGSLSDGLSIPAHDYIGLTYVSSGNGEGEIETAVFKTGGSGGTTVATLTLTYNSSNEVATVTKT